MQSREDKKHQRRERLREFQRYVDEFARTPQERRKLRETLRKVKPMTRQLPEEEQKLVPYYVITS